MATIELTIDGSYLSGSNGWAPADGIREIIQNAHDATVEHGGELKVSHSDDRLVIENTGSKLPRQALLIGNTSKRDRQDMIGQYGEGLKFGALVLVRGGHKVTIRTGPEVWVPSIGPSEKFQGANVLRFQIDGGREDRLRTRIEIEGISKEFWDEIKDNFLFLYKREVPQVETDRGSVLTSEKFKGRVYVKGILVQADPKLRYGYNLFQVELDRDRRIIGRYDLAAELRNVWVEALAKRPDLFEEFYRALDNNAPDVEGFDGWSSRKISGEALDAAAAEFRGRFGTDAIPVMTLEESADIAHLGVRGIVVSSALHGVLVQRLDDKAKTKAKLADEVTKTYGWDDLGLAEKQNLTRAVGLVAKATTCISELLGTIDVVDFRSPTLEGLYKDNRILVAKKCLASRSKALEVVVHERAHATTGAADGDKAHVAAIESTWAAIVEAVDRG